MNGQPFTGNDPRVKELADQLRGELDFNAAVDLLAAHMIAMEQERKLFDDAMDSVDRIAKAHHSAKNSHLELIDYSRVVTKAAGQIGIRLIEAARQLKKKSDDVKKGARLKLESDPKQADKAMVRECWDDWQKQPDRYKGKAAFARDMRDKFPNLKSQPVIEGWCRAWERES